jgi:hypothetical protein
LKEGRGRSEATEYSDKAEGERETGSIFQTKVTRALSQGDRKNKEHQSSN